VPYGDSDVAPEPGTWVLMASGAGLILLGRRKLRA